MAKPSPTKFALNSRHELCAALLLANLVQKDYSPSRLLKNEVFFVFCMVCRSWTPNHSGSVAA